MDVKVSKEVAEELEVAAAWYEAEQPGLGRKLIDAVEHAIQLLREPSPPLTPVLGVAAELGGKKLILHRTLAPLLGAVTIEQSRQHQIHSRNALAGGL